MVDDSLRLFPVEKQREAIGVATSLLPDDADLVLLSYTGGKAFGWGTADTDWDIKGFFAKPDWFFKVHSGGNMNLADGGAFDMTLINVHDVTDPNIRTGRWNLYYDLAQPFYINPEFDYRADFMDHVEPDTIEHIYPYSLRMERHRFEERRTPRAACHLYKEHVIPLYYLIVGEVESDVAEINKHEAFRYDELDTAMSAYGEEFDAIDGDAVLSDVTSMFDAIGERLG